MDNKVVIMLALQRSGTQAFGSVLNNHPDILYLGEVFYGSGDNINHSNNLGFFILKKINEGKAMEYLYFSDQEYIFDTYLDYLHNRYPEKILVIDVKYNSTHLFNGGWHFPAECPKLLTLIKKKRIPVIHIRRNLFRIYISEQIAKKTKIWHVTDIKSLEKDKHIKFKVDIKHMLEFLNLRFNSMKMIDNCLRDYNNIVNLKYIDIFTTDGNFSRETAQKISNFLNVSPDPFLKNESDYKKRISDFRNYIENLDEVLNALSSLDWFKAHEELCGDIWEYVEQKEERNVIK